MNYILYIFTCTLIFSSCKIYLTKGNKVHQISYSELPNRVKKAYFDIYKSSENNISDIPLIVNLDSLEVEFKYVKNTSIEIIKAGNKVFEINGKRFYLPWNLNKETRPYVFADKYVYCVVGNYNSWNNHSTEQLKKNQFLKIDLRRYLKY